jgi:chorismate mutase
VTPTTTRLSAIRGATTADHDTGDSIRAATAELLGEVLRRNALDAAEIVSIIFTATSDLRADFPAVAAREMGLSSTPLLCCQEIPVEGAVARCIRILVHCYLSDQTDAHHVYLHGAQGLRLDLPE